MRERLARNPSDLLVLLGAGLLFGSLFLTWSHQLPRAELARFHGATLSGVAANPTALQVYASAGIVLALLAVGIAAAALFMPRHGVLASRHGGLAPRYQGFGGVRGLTLAAVLLGLAFVIRAAADAPTNGLLLAQGSGAHARYVTDPAAAGIGETVAIVGLVCAAAGLMTGMLTPRVPFRS